MVGINESTGMGPLPEMIIVEMIIIDFQLSTLSPNQAIILSVSSFNFL
jgi:hypothetical protein